MRRIALAPDRVCRAKKNFIACAAGTIGDQPSLYSGVLVSKAPDNYRERLLPGCCGTATGWHRSVHLEAFQALDPTRNPVCVTRAYGRRSADVAVALELPPGSHCTAPLEEANCQN
jgi:hypothetical protein